MKILHRYTREVILEVEGDSLVGANLHGANLRGANLCGANLFGVNLDFSCMPLWCGDLKARYDKKQIVQQLYHVLSHVETLGDEDLNNILLTEGAVNLANTFHRVEECGRLEPKNEK